MAAGLPFPAAATVARIAFNWRAEKAAAWIAKSGVVAVANGERYYPKTTFPFTGRTDLTVDGRWLDARSTKVFLVERLQQCTHPFPFKRLYARSATEIAGEGKQESAKNTTKEKSSKHATDGRGQNKRLLESYVARALLPLAMGAEEDFEDPFPDLVRKPIHRMADAMTRRSTKNNVGEAACELSAGAMSSNLGGRGVEVMAAQMPALAWDTIPNEVATFRAAFQELLSSGEMAASLLPPLSTERVSSSKNPFVRADWIVAAPDERSRDIWCAKISANGSSVGRHIAALVKPGIEDVTPGRVALVCLSGKQTSHDEAVRRICGEFSADKAPPEGPAYGTVLDRKCTDNNERLLAFLRTALRDLGY